MVRDMIETSAAEGDVRMSAPIWDAMMELRSFLFAQRLLGAPTPRPRSPRQTRLVIALFDYYVDHPDEVPDEYRHLKESSTLVRAADYIAGMTDRYALRVFEDLMTPRSWAPGRS